LIEEFDEWYGWTAEASTPLTGRMPVVFAPEAAFLYLLPLWAGLAGGAIVKGTSPLVGRLGERILSERLTILDDPLRPEDPSSRPFDDEGVPCQRRALVDHGVLSGYLLDLATAQALGTLSTGNAVKRELFGRGTETPANPWPIQFVVEPGAPSIREMIAGLDEGLLITGGLGFHSGNYPQGQFAVQAMGFHIRKGRVIGRLDKTMISADIYADFSNVRSISSEQRPGYTGLLGGGIAPYVLVDSIQVSGR
jgi:PmbA protein